MNQMNPVEKSKYIRNRYLEYLHSSFKLSDDKLQKLFEDKLYKEVIFKGPYVALDLPFKKGRSIDQLVKDDVISPLFKQLNGVSFERPLYYHQEAAIKHINSGRSAVVTTGTGSGKTECFLYPIINEILREIEAGNNQTGIRALFLYPMNALVNDQMERVREILSGFDDITFGFFTGDTPETVSSKKREELGISDNELLSREEIREAPPHLLFTNYSMLEYLLIRPKDYDLFSPKYLNNWHYVVLDEAHTYHGALGIELSMLMRRLTAMADKKPKFILTSATLGTQGKSEPQIVEFAKNLTSAEFDEEDIIFSKRDNQLMTEGYSISSDDYIRLRDNKTNKDIVNEICTRYGSEEADDTRETIFNLLVHDRNVHDIYDQLKGQAQPFAVLQSYFSGILTEDSIIALIDLINYALKEGNFLFDLKYHSFVRPLAGAYISIGDNKELSLSDTNRLGAYKAFELGNCKYCNTPYIIGKIRAGKDSRLEYLYQNREVDIYENYGKRDFSQIDYFIFEDSYDEEHKDKLEKYELCAKCGNLSLAANKNARKCECGQEYRKVVYKVKTSEKDDNTKLNNVSCCPCCGHINPSGVVRSLNVGKDEATAIIAQTLYEAIDNGTTEEHARPKKLSLNIKHNKLEQSRDDAKQFIEFSDGRQQASFSAVFFDSNHERLLRKRLIWEVLKNNGYEDMPVEKCVSYLEKMIREDGLFSNELNSTKNAWVSVLYDLTKVDGLYDSEGVGLYYFDLKLDEILSNFTNEELVEFTKEYNMAPDDLKVLMQVVLTVFKTAPAIDYVKSTLSYDEKLNFLVYRRFENKIALQSQKSAVGKRSFLPIKGQSNAIVRYVQKVCECDENKAEELLQIIFQNLGVEGGIFDGKNGKYSIDPDKYVIKTCKKHQFYRCNKCGRLTPYNIHDKCVADKCTGRLIEVDPDDVLKDNYYRNEYMNKKIEKIVIQEHTAQLSKEDAKQYQDDFKNKKINILSCSTTFEMGIDIGNLETVFMRNVPPTPANYIQRAGRAGRRIGSSAYVITFCGNGSHDYTFFKEPEKMISGTINPPYFDIYNKKIIQRHLMASALGFFFRSNPQYFQSVKSLVFEDGSSEFNKYMASKPEDLHEYIDMRVIPEERFTEFHNFKWFSNQDDRLTYFADQCRQKAKEYEDARKLALEANHYDDAGYYDRQIEHLYKASVVSSLSEFCVIPKYGFPVDVVNLERYKDGKPETDSKTGFSSGLSRDLRIALSEYAPDSEIIANKEKYTSKFITLPRKIELPKKFYFTCPRCGKTNVFDTEYGSKECEYCGEPLQTGKMNYFLEPVYGFKTGINKDSTRLKPQRSYAGEVMYLGHGLKNNDETQISGLISMETSAEDEMLVMNKSYFYMCPVCGYADIDRSGSGIPFKTRKHLDVQLRQCNNDKLEKIKLGHIFKTDVAKFNIIPLATSCDDAQSKALSVLYAFLEGISYYLEIERTDIDGLVDVNMDTDTYDLVIYDNVPGGAGHVKRLANPEAIKGSLRAALHKVSQDCCDENTSCYNCLRNYYNQTYHSRLVRKYARDIIKELLEDMDNELEKLF